MKRITIMVSISAFLVLSLLSSYGDGEVEILQTSNILTYAMPYDFSEYSFYSGVSYATAQWNSAVYASLVKRHSADNRGWGPDLALNMPTVSPDGLTFTFTLKSDLKFSNGNELNTSDVKFSFQTILTPEINKNNYAIYFGYLDNSSVSIINNSTIVFTFLQSHAFPYQLLSFPIVDQEYFQARYDSCIAGVTNDCIWNDPSGSDVVSAGAFMVESIDTINQIVTVQANPYFYGSQNVQLSKIIFQKIATKSAAIAALAAGAVDIMDFTYAASINEFSGYPDVFEAYVGTPAHQELTPNHLNPYFGKGNSTPAAIAGGDASQAALKVRKAMSHVIDRNFAANEIMSGLALPAATPFPAASLGFDASIVPRNFSITAARNYMEMVGFDYATLGSENPDGTFDKSFFNITVLSPNTNPNRNQWAANFVMELPKIGIGVKSFVSAGWSTVIPRTFGYTGGLPPAYDDGGFDVVFLEYQWGIDWNPGTLYDGSGSCDIGTCSNFMNFDLYENITNLASIIDAYLTELDFNTRLLIAQDIQQEMYNWLPGIPILYPQSHLGYYAGITGLDFLLLALQAQEWENVQISPYTPPSTTTSTPTTLITSFFSSTTSSITRILSVSTPPDVSFTKGSVGNTITWILEGTAPSYYAIFQDGILVDNAGWVNGQEVTISLDELEPGTYEFTIRVYDSFDDIASDTVIVTVLEPSTTSTTRTSSESTSPFATSSSSQSSSPSSSKTDTAGIPINTKYIFVSMIVALFFARKKFRYNK